MNDAKDLPIKPAGTVALIRQGATEIEALMLRRNKALAFAAGAWVFPGGSVDADDIALCNDDLAEAAKVAACREAMEECGLVVDPKHLYQISHWTTPKGESRRFSTWLFVAALRDHSEVQIDNGEIHDACWLSVSDVFVRHHAGELPMLPPTYMTLKAISEFSAVDDVVAALEGSTPVVVEPHGVPIQGGFAAMYPGDAGYESLDANAPGARHRTEIVGGIINTVVDGLSDSEPRLDKIR
jgi:8-oxo-dGTP pyrophosphatase MutT (NUDIX family)